MIKYITLVSMKITNSHSVLLSPHITMSNHDFIEEILTLYLCRIIEIIESFILMIARLKKLVSLCKNILMRNKYLVIKSNWLSMMLIKKPCKIFIKAFISIVRMEKSLLWLMVMTRLMVDKYLNCIMLSSTKRNPLYFIATFWR